MNFGKFLVHRLWKWTAVKLGKKKEKATEMVAKVEVAADASANSKSKFWFFFYPISTPFWRLNNEFNFSSRRGEEKTSDFFSRLFLAHQKP